MSFVPLKKFLLVSIFTIFLGVFFSPAVNAYSLGDFGKDFFSAGNQQGLSFTQYSGQLAQLSTDGYDSALVQSTDIKQYIIKIVNFALGFLGLIAVLIVIYGGVLYVTAAGEDEKVGKGKKAIAYAAIGLLIVMGSFAFVNTIIKGGTGGVDGGNGVTAVTASQGFNASAEQVRALAVQIYNGFDFLSQATDELKNIKNDVEKDSLNPANFPNKNEILSFLGSVGSKLNNLKSKVQPFSVAEAKMNEILRALDKDIDKINNIGNSVYLKVTNAALGTTEECNVSEARTFWEGATGASDKEICENADFKVQYPSGLLAVWTEMFNRYSGKSKFATLDTSTGESKPLLSVSVYDDILKQLADDYHTDLERIFGELELVYSNYSNISAIGSINSKANGAHTLFQSTSGYGYGTKSFTNGTVTTIPTITESPTGLLNSVSSAKWSISADIATAGNYMVYGLKQQAILYSELSKLQFVQARLTADTVEGSAPLAVNFNALTTVDPAGGSVKADNIYWDLGGTQTVEKLTGLSADNINSLKGVTINGNMLISTDNSVNCAYLPAKGVISEKEFIGATAKSCLYTRPGTYTAAIKINSNDATKYAPGISILTIKVRPPTTKIELKVKGNGQAADQVVMHYEGDILKTDKQSVQVTTKDAKDGKGVTFDATGTKDRKGCTFSFGDGKTSEFTSDCLITHQYKEAGKYQVTVEVENLLRAKDSKIFTLEVASIAANFKASPASGANINDNVTFDASSSKSDLGKITNYQWSIKPSVNQPLDLDEDPFLDEGASHKILNYAFKNPQDYDITLTVTDNTNTSTYTLNNYRIKSQPPVAQFDFKNLDKTQPGTIHFDGGKSYDPDNTKDFTYSWSITPAGDWEVVSKPGSSLTSKAPIIKFKKIGNYEVTLNVTGPNLKEYSEISKTVKIDNVLDIGWDSEQQSTATLDETGKADVKFELISNTAKTYEINFGDGETGSGEFGEKITHTYDRAGKYPVKVTVYDDTDKENSIEKKIFIAGGDQTIAKARFYINNEEIQDLADDVEVSKKDLLTFDAIDSKNSDGSLKNLKYSWDFGDGKNSSKLKATHTYKELSPKDPGYFQVKLSVYDSKDPEKTASDEFRVIVVNVPPTFSSISAVPQPVNNTLVTPVSAVMKVYGAEDPDGQIVKYKWWYFDVKNPDQQFGVQITTSPSAKLIIGTRGKEGEEIDYGFGLEVTDSDGLTFSNEESIQQGQYAKLNVINGANALPTAKFSVTGTSVFAGDKVTFTSSSTDPDGNISQYIWDFDGDGFFNDEPATEGSSEHTYDKINKAGFDVRLKVVDDKGGEAISDPIKVHVDSLAQPPTAGFVYTSIPGSDGLKIKFTNTSSADTTAGADILSYQWDFDNDSLLPTADSNGDGKKDNDTDSQAKDPERLYPSQGTYKVKLTVTDTQGNKDEVVNTLKIPMANAPQAAFTYILKEGQLVFTNNSKSDVVSGSIITKNVWDFDINSDSDGDGKKDNDNDSQLKDPLYAYGKAGTYMVRLTVIDNQGGIGMVTNEVDFNPEVITAADNYEITPSTDTGLKAVLSTDPLPGTDLAVYLSGQNGTIKFDFSKSTGSIQYYIIDKNIHFDTNGDGDKTNDEDFKTSLSGTWSTNFDKSWGQTVVKLTVKDIYGNKSTATQEVKFQ